MAQGGAGDLAVGRNVANELDAVRIGRFGWVQLLVGAFDAVDYGSEGDVAGKAGSAIVMDGADGGANLIVGISGDVLHEEIDPAGVALQDTEDLKCAVADVDLGRCGSFHGLGVAEMGCYVFGQDTRKQDRKEAAESG